MFLPVRIQRFFSTSSRPLNVCINKNLKKLELKWGDGIESNYHLSWLRVHCPSVIHSTGQREIFPGDFNPEQMSSVDAEYKDGTVQLVWKDGHVSCFDPQWLRHHAYCKSSEFISQCRVQTRPVGLKASDPIPTLAYGDLVSSKDCFLQWLDHQIVDGICLVKGVPTEDKEIARLASLISPISHSFLYGDVFDVVATVQAVNVAYTSLQLRFHMDLAYYESIPGFQYLHCLRNDPTIKGGMSLFIDVFEAAEFFRKSEPEDFEVLCRVPATFQKIRDQSHTPKVERREKHPDAYYATHMEYQRPHFQLDSNGEITTVTWSPPFEGVLQVPFEDVEPYYRAYRKFQNLLEDSPYSEERQITHLMQPGDTMCFNNRRMLHARTAFEGTSPDSVRHFQGTYLNSEEVLSRYLVLKKEALEGQQQQQKQGTDIIGNNVHYIPRIGNGSLPHFL